MKRRIFLAVSAGLVSAAVLVTVCSRSVPATVDEKAPTREETTPKPADEMKGKPLGYWIERLKRDSAEERTAAVDAIRRIDRDSWVSQADVSGKRSTLSREERAAVEAALVQAIQDVDANVRLKAAETLVQVFPPPTAVPVLIEALRDTEAGVRGHAALGLGQFASRRRGEANAALPALIAALKDEDFKVRGNAAWALRHFGPGAEVAVPALADAVRDKDSFVRARAAEALGGIGPGAKAAVPALIEAVRSASHRSPDSPNISLHYAATITLGKIGPAAREAVPALIEALQAEAQAGQAPSRAVTGVVSVPAVRGYAAEALGQIGPDAKAAAPALADVIKFVNYRERVGTSFDFDLEYLRYASAEALKKIDPQAVRDAVSEMIAMLEHKDARIRRCAASGLGHMGLEAARAAPALLKALDDKGFLVHAAASMALKKLPVIWRGSQNADTTTGLSLASSLGGMDYILFEHDGGTDSTAVDIPLSVKSRFTRIWHLNVSDAGCMWVPQRAGRHVLLRRHTTDDRFTAIATADHMEGDKIEFTGIRLTDGYYTLGAVYPINFTVVLSVIIAVGVGLWAAGVFWLWRRMTPARRQKDT